MRRTIWWLADEALDLLPYREDGRWHWYGCWGCTLRNSGFLPDWTR